jgi:hypothetical protein
MTIDKAGQGGSTLTQLIPTPHDWGPAQAAQAPVWSEVTWRQVCATLGIKLPQEGGEGNIEP